MNSKPILIVGAGPTGLVLALWLAKLGIAVRIIDKNEEPGETSRAVVIQARTLELYNQIGIAEAVIEAGIKLQYFALRKNNHAIKTVNVGEIGTDITPYSFILSFPQDDHERLLINQLEQYDIHVERNTELLAFSQTEEKVTVILKTNRGKEQAEFTFVCGCDGAHSTAREQAGIQFPGGTYQQKFFVADVESPDNIMQGLQIGVQKKDFCLAFPVRSSQTVRLIGIVPEQAENKPSITFADVRESVDTNMDLTINQINWFSTYHVHHRVVPQFRKGRLFLAGDTAHVHSPVGGQGMNTGIGDAVNLAWKLAAVIQGQADETILDTYETERLPFARKLVKTTDKVFQFVTSMGIAGLIWRTVFFPYIFPLIFQYDKLKHYFFRFISQTEINYRDSPLSIKNTGKLQGGDRLPWIKTEDSDNFSALTSLSWQVHIYGKASESIRILLEKQAIPLFEFPWSEEAENKGLIENAACLIRPDGYISVVDMTDLSVIPSFLRCSR